MRINNNITALNTLRQYSTNTNATNKSMEKLSSGLRINRAGDDAAGLAISEKMRAQIRGIDMASKNSQDAISLVQTAEGALTETHSILQRMNELAVQSASDTNDTTVDRAALQQEFDQLKSEIDDIASQTKFNGKALLDGTFGGNTASATGLSSDLSVSAASTASAGTISIATVADWDAGTATAGAGSVTFTPTATITAASTAGTIADGSAQNGTYYLEATGAALNAMTFNLLDAEGNTIATSITTSVSAGSANTIDFGDYGDLSVTLAAGAVVGDLTGTFDGTSSGLTYEISGGTDAVATATIGGQSVSQDDTSITLATGVTMDISNLTTADWASQDALNTALFGSTTGSATVTVTEGQSLTIQTGSSQGETLSISISAMDSETLGLTSDVQIVSLEEAESAITTIESAINTVSSQRASLGAYQNRLEHKINNLSTSSENLSAAESRIRDVDMAEEMVEFTKNNILLQAAQSMLAQANAQPQGVLQLLQ